jgi:protein-L-isoaspartate(D-aspartate) O-methyltransferase
MTADPLPDPGPLHAGLVDLLLARGTIKTSRVETAMRSVPRHAFVPGVPAETAYAPDDAVVTRRDPAGAALSSASAPGVVAAMLEQLDVQPGDRILEIGAGTGYNAALLAELTGPAGHVVTVDIDQDVTDEAAAALESTGYGRVEVVRADGAEGHAGASPYDRIIVTAGAWDLSPAWSDQLARAGRLVVPLRITGGTTRVIAFDRDGGHLVSRSMATCGFLAMRGISAHPEPAVVLADGVTLLPGDGPAASPASLVRALATPAIRSWSGILVRAGRQFADLDLYLAATSHGFCRIAAQPEAVAADVAAPAFRRGGAAMAGEAGSFAYLTKRPASPAEDGLVFELGVRSHGPGRHDLAAALLEQISQWDRKYRDLPPSIEAHRKPAQVTATTVIDKPHTLLAVIW